MIPHSPIPPTRLQNFLLVGASTLIGTVLAFAAAEWYFRSIETSAAAATELSADCRWIADPDLGYKNPASRRCEVATPEFRYAYRLNADGHPDLEFDPAADRCNILVVGDSHTFAVGVTDQDTWPNVVEKELRSDGAPAVQVMNTAVAGYGIGQEYFMALRYAEQYRARHAILGFSLATDAYDIRTPADGGFIYGAQFSRRYFDLVDGRLVLRPNDSADARVNGSSAPVAAGQAPSWSTSAKNFLREHSALVRATSRGAIGQYAARLLRATGSNPWPSAESVVAKDLQPVDAKSWQLVEQILALLQQQLQQKNIGLTVVVIPYLPQVYDEVWERAFGGNDRYERFAGNARMQQICERQHLDCFDVTKDIIAAVKSRKHWLHYPQDAHPTPEGQSVIGSAVTKHIRNRIRCDQP